MKTFTALSLVLGLATLDAAAQSATAMPVAAHALTHAREGQVQGCGLRLTGGAAGRAASSWFDVSFNVFARGIGLAQSIAYELTRSEFDGEARPARVPVRSTWVQTAAESPRRGENLERRDTLIYTLLAEDVLALFEAAAESRSVTLGIRRWGEREDAVYRTKLELDEGVRSELHACLSRLHFE